MYKMDVRNSIGRHTKKVIQKSGKLTSWYGKCLMIYKVLAPSQLRKNTSHPPSVAAPPSCEESATPSTEAFEKEAAGGDPGN